MNKNNIKNLLKDYPVEDAEKFASYIVKLTMDDKNYWLKSRSDEDMAELFRRVAKDGLIFDGEHITIQKTGISYDYIAYKNKMFLSYPESKIDLGLMYKGDTFDFSKESGSVKYTHKFGDPFNQKEVDIIGGYCVMKNKRGEFITILTKEDIDKHRKVARTDYIWAKWFKEMAMKTIMKKACKIHFSDIYQNIEENDNENCDLDNPLDLDIKYKQEIDEIKDVESLRAYYMDNKGLGKDFNEYVTKRKNQLTQEKNENTSD